MKTKIIILAILFISALIAVSGCNGENAEDVIDEEKILEVEADQLEEEQSPVIVVEQFLEATTRLDLVKTKNYIATAFLDQYEESADLFLVQLEDDGSEMKTFFYETVNLELKHTEFDIIDYTIDGNNAVVVIAETSPDTDDLWAFATARIDEQISSGEIDVKSMTETEILENALKIYEEVMPELEKINVEKEIPLIKENNQWRITDFYIDDLAAITIKPEEKVAELDNGLMETADEETISYDDGTYIGEIKDGKPHGKGTWTVLDGDIKYVGDWEDGLMHGQGEFTVLGEQGFEYVGDFKDGIMHGQGELTNPDGNKYVGDFKDGMMHGEGKLIGADGEEFLTGTFENNEYIGP